jgi:hypothetical protein
MERYVVTDATVFRLCQPEIFSDPLTEMLRSGARVRLPRRCADNIRRAERCQRVVRDICPGANS